jgi:hypothetical protein
MPLHGIVRVNGQRIGSYEIRRLGQLGDPGAEYEYAWTVEATRYGAQVRQGMLRHRYCDGAGVLLAKVMLAAEDAA